MKLDPEKPCGVVTKTGGRFYLDGAYNFIAKTDAAIDADLEKVKKKKILIVWGVFLVLYVLADCKGRR